MIVSSGETYTQISFLQIKYKILGLTQFVFVILVAGALPLSITVVFRLQNLKLLPHLETVQNLFSETLKTLFPFVESVI